MQLKPINNQVLVRPFPLPGEVGGILLPDNRQDNKSRQGRVVAVGPRVKYGIQRNNIVMLPPHMGRRIPFGGETLVLTEDDGIIAILDEDSNLN